MTQLFGCTVGILSFSFLKLLCFHPQEGHPLHSSIILHWEARNDPARLTKGYESVESWTGSSRETDGFFPCQAGAIEDNPYLLSGKDHTFLFY